MMKNLYIVSGCNGAGKTTASYTAGINNLFKLFVPVVDYWAIFDNSATPRRIVATGGRKSETVTMEEELLRTIKAYVK